MLSKFLLPLRHSYYILELTKRQYRKPSDLEKVQNKRLRNIVAHAYYHVPFYHSLFKKVGVKPSDIRNVADLSRLPIITKADVQQNWEDFISKTAQSEKSEIIFTSGTTGTPLKIVVDNSTRDINNALAYYIFFECGMRISDRYLDLSAAFPSISKCVFRHGPGYVLRGNYLSVFNDPHLNVKEMLKINPEVISSFPTALECIIEDYSDEVEKVRPRLVFSTSEMLTEKHRELVKDCWGLEPHDTYGSREFRKIAFECNEREGLHVLTDWILLELVKDDDCVGPNELGRTIVTSLHNYSMPLIRYDLGDLAAWSDSECACGRGWPLLRRIEGRTRDIVTLPSGRRIRPTMQVFLREIEGVKRFQIILQERRRSVIVKVLCNENIRPLDKRLIEEQVIRKVKFALLHEEFNIQVEFVNEIPQQPSGKILDLIIEK